MKKILILFVCICAIISSCGNKKEQDIEKEQASGVVLVQNQSYYEIVFSNGESLYFTSFDNEKGIKGIATEEDSVEVATSFGTGFFVSAEGEIATNNHVVANVVADRDVNRSMRKIIDALKEVMAVMYNRYDARLDTLKALYDYANYSDEVSMERFLQIRDMRDAVEKERDEYAQYYNQLDDINPSDSEIKYHNRVSIAYNDTYVTTTSDFVSCVVTKTDPEHDLAIIQLKDKKTPEGKYIFKVADDDPLEKYSFMDNITKRVSDDKNSKVYMTSFNLGPTLALTKEGIKSQFNSGTISQRTADRLMYSVPTLPGSSGSPVVNMKGELVAVNYAGLSGTQNFNYGIRVKHLRNLMEK